MCRLCQEINETKRLNNIFKKSGTDKNLQHKISRTCGIYIDVGDNLPRTICCKCERFVEKMWSYRQACQKAQVALRQQISVKRMHNSPGHKMLTRFDPEKKYDEHKTERPRKKLFDAVPVIGSMDMTGDMHLVDDEEPKKVIKNIEISCKNMCKRNGEGSMLLNNSYQALAEFSADNLWAELVEKHSTLVDVFNAVSGNSCVAKDTPKNVQLKYTLIYSILMNIRWHELSLFQRLNSVTLIEGGCSKEVYMK